MGKIAHFTNLREESSPEIPNCSLDLSKCISRFQIALGQSNDQIALNNCKPDEL